MHTIVKSFPGSVQAFHQLFKDDMRGAKAEQWGQLKAHLHC